MPSHSNSSKTNGSGGDRSQKQPQSFTILVVEDDHEVREMLGNVLQLFGFNVNLAASGKQALGIYQHNPDAIDLVLMDVRMPFMDGPETLAAMKKINAQVVCCFMSGYTGNYSIDELLQLGARAVISKPFQLDHLRQTLLDALQENDSSDGMALLARPAPP